MWIMCGRYCVYMVFMVSSLCLVVRDCRFFVLVWFRVKVFLISMCLLCLRVSWVFL